MSLLLLLVACSPSGLTLEVAVDDPEISRVELFVGEHCSGDCPRGTIPPGLPVMAVTDTYVVVDTAPWTLTRADFDDGVAGFRIESPEDTSLPILVVVGYDAQDQIRWSSTFHDVAVPSQEPAYWQVRLSPTTAIAASLEPQPAGTERVARWQQPSQRLPSCLLLEHWSDRPEPTRELVVPDEDHDCDEVAETAECAPWVPDAVAVPPRIEDASCVLPAPLPGRMELACLLGGPECTEDPQSARDQCVPVFEPRCVSSLVCQCAGKPDFAACVEGVVTEGIVAGTTPYLKCSIQVDAEGYRCDDTPIEADAGAYLSSSGSTKCTGIGIDEWAAPIGPFGSALAIDETSKVKLGAFDEPCRIDLLLEGNTTTESTLAAVEIDLDNNNHLVVPARFEFRATGCADSSHCEFVAPDTNDSLFECLDPGEALTCAPDTNNGCAGPMCNGQCCGAGEMCTPNGCSCGGGAACDDGLTCESGITTQDQCGSICCGGQTPCPA